MDGWTDIILIAIPHLHSMQRGKKHILSLIAFLSVSPEYIQVAQLSQRDRTAGWVSYGQKRKTGGTGGQYLRTI